MRVQGEEKHLLLEKSQEVLREFTLAWKKMYPHEGTLIQKEIGVMQRLCLYAVAYAQQEKPEDFIISSGKMYSVREFIEMCALELGWNEKEGGNGIIWEGEGINEIGKRADNNEIVIRIDPRYFRATEVDELLVDSKAREKLGWEPKISISQLISEMIKEDSYEAKKNQFLKTKDFLVHSPKEQYFFMNHIIPIILAGGAGSRLWPLSKESFPKQFLNLLDNNELTLLQQTYKRIEDLQNLSKPIIVCNEEHNFIVADQMRNINISL